MKALEPLLMRDVRQLAVHSFPEFAQLCAERLHVGDRLLTLFG